MRSFIALIAGMSAIFSIVATPLSAADDDRDCAGAEQSSLARTDMPDVAYAPAKTIGCGRGELKWFVRPYSLDPRTMANAGGVPLHPAVERHHRKTHDLD
ncbi:MAG TPA: hypothetical protein VNZ43_03140 [Sphingomonadaceae bacterium]|nr:hypothetical protein [Sphingomonadaceae bacterium]